MQSYILTKPRLKERTADISGFSAEMTFISASAVPNKDEPGKSMESTMSKCTFLKLPGGNKFTTFLVNFRFTVRDRCYLMFEKGLKR